MNQSSINIRLRPVEPDDLDIFFVQEQDNEARWMAAFVSDDPTDRQAFDDHWTKILGNREVVNRTIIYHDSGNEPGEDSDHVAGNIAFFEQFGKPSVSYWIGREFWGRGIATAALRLFLEELNRFPIFARVASDNNGSIRVLEKCGFVRCGEDSGFANGRKAETQELIFSCESLP